MAGSDSDPESSEDGEQFEIVQRGIDGGRPEGQTTFDGGITRDESDSDD